MGVCIDEVPNRFSLENVELPIDDGPAGEFPWLGLSGSRRNERGDYRRRNEQSTMRRYFDNIIAGKGVRSGKNRNESLIERLSILMNSREVRPPRLRLPWIDVFGRNRQRARTAQSDERDGSASRCG